MLEMGDPSGDWFGICALCVDGIVAAFTDALRVGNH